ncbi:hypothetical protein AVEN_221056-1 [Araneus ventricosus]|uniref:Endonuclease/exonuclease/phosphatase domain-containing protein n=1 Tax=Araneus ventricosus TaxID=182803 RepID=A0A4Y2WID2_ARAVE|nr:hypothetical protein AVEN_221056-1 [Araneus ventricosus]
MRFISWNANGISKKIKELKYFIAGEIAHVVGIQETHLRPSDKIKVPNHNIYGSYRISQRGGGIAILAKNGINLHKISFSFSTFENSAIVMELGNHLETTLVQQNGSTKVVVIIYKSHHCLIGTAELNNIFSSNSQIICLGDFNAKRSPWSVIRTNQNGKIIYDSVNYSNLSSSWSFNIRQSYQSTLEFLLQLTGQDFKVSSPLPFPAKKIENAIAIQEFEITSAIKLASRTEAVNTTHYKLPSYITRKITYKNHIRILHQLTRYPPNKYEVNRLGKETQDEIRRWDQKKWTEAVSVLNSEDHAV